MFVTTLDITRIKYHKASFKLHIATYCFNAKQISLQSRHLGQTGVVGYLFMLGFSFTFDLIVPPAQAKTE